MTNNKTTINQTRGNPDRFPCASPYQPPTTARGSSTVDASYSMLQWSPPGQVPTGALMASPLSLQLCSVLSAIAQGVDVAHGRSNGVTMATSVIAVVKSNELLVMKRSAPAATAVAR